MAELWPRTEEQFAEWPLHGARLNGPILRCVMALSSASYGSSRGKVERSRPSAPAPWRPPSTSPMLTPCPASAQPRLCPPEPETDPNAVEQAWAETVERRMREVREGKVRTVSSKDVFAALDAIVDPR